MTGKIIGQCETCGCAISEGDLHYADGEIYLCSEHAPMLSDAIKQADEALKDWDSWAGDYWSYADEDDLRTERNKWAEEIAATGDRSLASVAG